MLTVISILKILVSFVILNVWVLRRNKATIYRGGQSKNLSDEIKTYGLPAWSFKVIGTSKIALSFLLLASIWAPKISILASAGLGIFMLGAIFMHLKAKDEPIKFLPAALLFTGCVVIVLHSI